MTLTGEAPARDAGSSKATNTLLVFTAASAESALLKLKPCAFPACEAFCCYDGVYLKDGEEDLIRRVVAANPQYFKHLPEEYIVDGNWYDRFKGRKTAVRPFCYESPDYPRHFESTRCVFAYDDGRCSLQAAAEGLNLNPWRFKPAACWFFPLRFFGDRVIIPPHGGEPDPDYINDDYPGFVTFLPCGRHSEDGLPWYEVLQREILYLLTVEF